MVELFLHGNLIEACGPGLILLRIGTVAFILEMMEQYFVYHTFIYPLGDFL